ncbi:hypothetical protein [Flexithrix dorotheae]|uniref:hypothetical protein n=1 Tax=Flexithrix dorotheae TaxID=70993 RepID=UPI0003A94B1C|nr:hypothetical protein [Flexithrix dorotheae]
MPAEINGAFNLLNKLQFPIHDINEFYSQLDGIEQKSEKEDTSMGFWIRLVRTSMTKLDFPFLNYETAADKLFVVLGTFIVPESEVDDCAKPKINEAKKYISNPKGTLNLAFIKSYFNSIN